MSIDRGILNARHPFQVKKQGSTGQSLCHVVRHQSPPFSVVSATSHTEYTRQGSHADQTDKKAKRTVYANHKKAEKNKKNGIYYKRTMQPAARMWSSMYDCQDMSKVKQELN